MKILSLLVFGLGLSLAVACGSDPAQPTTASNPNTGSATTAPTKDSASAPATAPSATAVNAAAGAVDPCTLLTREDIAQVLSKELKAAQVVAEPRPHCEYTLPSDPGGLDIEGQIILYVFSTSDAKTSFEVGKTAQDAKTEPVPGIGDDAYWSPSIDTLNVLDGNTYFTLSFFGVQAGNVESAQALAQSVVERLP